MSIFEMIKDQLSKTVPYALHTGVVVEEVGQGVARASLEQRQETSNHLGSQHAGALFTLGEAASGAAMAGGFAERILELQFIAANASIAYTRVAKGAITANGAVEAPLAELHAQLREAGKAQFSVIVTMTDAGGDEVAKMKVDWNVREARPKQEG